jgi:hypothetical protein
MLVGEEGGLVEGRGRVLPPQNQTRSSPSSIPCQYVPRPLSFYRFSSSPSLSFLIPGHSHYQILSNKMTSLIAFEA